MLVLNEELLIAKGNERLCYIHPEDSRKVIKLTHKENGRQQNKLEYIYYNYLQKRAVSFQHIAECYGWETIENKRGLLFERVLNYDGSASITLSKAIEEKLLTKEYLEQLLEELRLYLEENTILFVDVGLDNIMCKELKKGVYSLVIIDGLGARRPGFKFWVYRHFLAYAKYKVKSQWPKVQSNVDALWKRSL